MTNKKRKKSTYDLAVEAVDELGDPDLMLSVRQLREHELVQLARAEVVLKELLSGLPERLPDEDGKDPLDSFFERRNRVIKENLDAYSIWDFIWCCGDHVGELRAGRKAMRMAEARHNKPGGTRDKRAAIVAAWVSGKYSSRDICAEQECGALGMSFSTARKALRGVPKPT